MKSKKLLTLSASVAASVSASGAVHHKELAEPLTITHDGLNSGINFLLSEDLTADYSNAGATEVGEFRLSFHGETADKPFISSPLTSGILTQPNTSIRYAKKLNENALIAGSAGTFSSSNAINRVYFSYDKSPEAPWQPSNTHGYIGLQFEKEGTDYYGWAEVRYSTANALSLYSFAYQDDGSPILAGTLIPEPKTNALLAALVAGSVVMYGRRRAVAKS